ncbi:MAG TPA: pilus assembly protein TadD, partial [Accumulibacter sp.]|nr:pilus assembly protein TadD [Accumulibacter sp.]
MKPIQHLAFSLALALSFPAAGETIDIDKSDGKAGARGARRAAVAAAARQAEINTPGELSGEILYQVLLAEMALQRGRAEFASQNYYDLATRTNDPGIIARAVEIAGHARRTDRALELAKLWIQVDPDSKRAQHVLINVM